MQVLIDELTTQLVAEYDGKTIGGDGADYASELGSTGTIHVYIDEWEDIDYPCIRFDIIQELFAGSPLECCEGGVMKLRVNFIVWIDTKIHGQRMAWALVEELRKWLCGLNESSTLTPEGYTYVPTIGIPTSDPISDGMVYGISLKTDIVYLRQPKG